MNVSPGATAWRRRYGGIVRVRLPGRQRESEDRDRPEDDSRRTEDDFSRVAEALEFLPVGVIVEDESGRMITGNTRAQSPLGDIQADALASAALARVLEHARSGIPASETLDLHGAPARVVDIVASPLPSGGVVAVLVDSSERRRLDAVRRDFVANVNHELRTPIGALGLLAEALEEETDPDVTRRLAQRISAEVDRAGSLIEDLLDFSRVEADQSHGRQVMAISDVMESARDRVLARAERHGVRLHMDQDIPDATVDGDREQLISAVANLVDNAVKYSDSESSVSISTSVEEKWIAIEISDQGVGIPSRDLDRIFERFYRVDRARDRRTGGTGLGLAIVRHVATNHGGEIEVQSREGVGSTFTLRLPRSAAEVATGGLDRA